MAKLRLSRPQMIWLAAIAGGAILIPPTLLALASQSPSDSSPDAPFGPLTPPPREPVDLPSGHPLFVAVPVEGDAADAPDLVGIVGRLGSDAVAMVRGADGKTASLRPGDKVDGWTLVTMSPDAALFQRGSRRLRVAVPNADAPGDANATDPDDGAGAGNATDDGVPAPSDDPADQ